MDGPLQRGLIMEGNRPPSAEIQKLCLHYEIETKLADDQQEKAILAVS